MDSIIYEIEDQSEASHWWHVCRRDLFRRVIMGFNLKSDIRTLDVGTSTGTNLRLLSNMGFKSVTGVDYSREAIKYCARKGLGNVKYGDMQNLPFSDGAFDLVLATDIIEHIEDDSQAMRELVRVLSPGGKALITVPTFMSLWGSNDDLSHHKRRYNKLEISALAHTAGLRIEKQFYFNFFLFVPIWVVRRIFHYMPSPQPSELKMNPPIINLILKWIFSLDVTLAPILHPPFGVSYLLACEKPVSLENCDEERL